MIPALAALLQDSVHGGASVGFLAPVAAETAERYWQGVFAQLAGGMRLWVAESAGRLVGSVQLELCGKENGRHRAEVQKLFVHSAARGRGIGSQLLRAVEAFAREQGRTLLVLDTLRGSFAEAMYRRQGWQFVGYIPEYAARPDGELEATAVFYKQIRPV
ncbi:MAG TPA: GNAT family N-acetyltransferase [Steroidobacteraceae bacterium]|nr:GNAT family N-acetyltransferase [Steroidobacteraceae bacterium]